MKNLVIAVDGPAGSGKSTIAKIIADRLNLIYIDTGAMYRAVTLKLLNNKIPLDEITTINKLVKQISIELVKKDQKLHIILDNEDVTEDIRSREVTNNVSLISSYQSVREHLVDLQRRYADNQHIIMDGRDIGTVVLPNATLKIFLEASVDERANRRYKELLEKGESVDLDKLKEEIKTRDYKDSHREISPLKKAEDAVEVDTTKLSIEQVVEKIISLVPKNFL